MSALYAPEFQGGATLVVRRLAAELLELGHTASVFSGRATADEPLGAVARDRLDETRTYRVNVGEALHPWSGEGYWNPVATEAFGNFLDEARPDVAHVHSLQGLGVGLFEAARLRDVPIVLTMHDWWWLCPCLFRLSPEARICPARPCPAECSGQDGLDFTARDATLRAALAQVARILVPSLFLRDSLVENGFDGRRIQVQENGLDTPSAPLRAAGDGGGPPRFVFLGGAGNRAKGLDVLLEAASGLRGEFLLDAYGVSVDEAASAAGLGSRFVRHDAFAPERLDAVLEGADVVVLPSLMRESFSLVTREALLRGRSVITSDCGGPEEVVRDGLNGFVVPSGSPDALRDAMARFVREPALAAKLGSSTTCVVVSPRAFAKSSEAIYREVLRASAPRAPAPGMRRLSGRRVLFLTGMDGAPLRYRAWNLIERMRRVGVHGTVLFHSDRNAVAAARRADLVVLYRAPFSAAVSKVVREARKRGVPVVFSADDFVFRPDDLAHAPALDHPDPRVVEGYRQSVEGHARCLAAADAFLGSTPELTSAAADLGVPAYCLPNGLSKELVALSDRALRRDPGPRPSARVRVGFASGTDTHDGDLALVAPALAAVLSRSPQATLILGGPVTLPEPLLAVRDQIERWPFVAWSDLPERLAGLDVNLAPLDVDRAFNLGKSEVKLLEAAAVGVPTLASDAPAFRRASREGQLALLCRDPAEWEGALSRLIADPGLRRTMGLAARTDVCTRYGGDAQADDLVGILDEIFERGPSPNRSTPEAIPLEAGVRSVVALEPGDAIFDAYQLSAESGGPLRPGAEIEQRFTCRRDGLRRVDVRVGTYARTNDHDVHLSLQDETAAVLAESRLPASQFVDRRFVSLELPAPVEAAGRSFTIRAEAPNATDGNEILLWHAPSEVGGLTIGGREEEGRSLSFRTFGSIEGALA